MVQWRHKAKRIGDRYTRYLGIGNIKCDVAEILVRIARRIEDFKICTSMNQQKAKAAYALIGSSLARGAGGQSIQPHHDIRNRTGDRARNREGSRVPVGCLERLRNNIVIAQLDRACTRAGNRIWKWSGTALSEDNARPGAEGGNSPGKKNKTLSDSHLRSSANSPHALEPQIITKGNRFQRFIPP